MHKPEPIDIFERADDYLVSQTQKFSQFCDPNPAHMAVALNTLSMSVITIAAYKCVPAIGAYFGVMFGIATGLTYITDSRVVSRTQHTGDVYLKKRINLEREARTNSFRSKGLVAGGLAFTALSIYEQNYYGTNMGASLIFAGLSRYTMRHITDAHHPDKF